MWSIQGIAFIDHVVRFPTKEIHCHDFSQKGARFSLKKMIQPMQGGRTAGVNWLTSMMMEPMAAEPSRVNTSQSIKELHSLGLRRLTHWVRAERHAYNLEGSLTRLILGSSGYLKPCLLDCYRELIPLVNSNVDIGFSLQNLKIFPPCKEAQCALVRLSSQ